MATEPARPQFIQMILRVCCGAIALAMMAFGIQCQFNPEAAGTFIGISVTGVDETNFMRAIGINYLVSALVLGIGLVMRMPSMFFIAALTMLSGQTWLFTSAATYSLDAAGKLLLWHCLYIVAAGGLGLHMIYYPQAKPVTQ